MTIQSILKKVRDAGALDDNNGGEDWRYSDNAIAEAEKAIQAVVLEARIEEATRGLNLSGKYEHRQYFKDRIATLQSQRKKLGGDNG